MLLHAGLCDASFSLERRDVEPDCVISQAEPRRQIVDGPRSLT
jgi:hypothetical protein